MLFYERCDDAVTGMGMGMGMAAPDASGLAKESESATNPGMGMTAEDPEKRNKASETAISENPIGKDDSGISEASAGADTASEVEKAIDDAATDIDGVEGAENSPLPPQSERVLTS